MEARRKVPRSLRSCHTATIDGYVVEGHVPARIIRRLLRERPNVVGIAVAGMPAGSPGMESPNPVSYEVVAWAESGQTRIFAKVQADGTIRN